MCKRLAIVLLTMAFAIVAAAAQTTPTEGVGTPSVTVLDKQEVQGILGRDVRSTADENMGRIVDVLVDGAGAARAGLRQQHERDGNPQ